MKKIQICKFDWGNQGGISTVGYVMRRVERVQCLASGRNGCAATPLRIRFVDVVELHEGSGVFWPVRREPPHAGRTRKRWTITLASDETLPPDSMDRPTTRGGSGRVITGKEGREHG